jgi:hypothetical protein
VVENLTPKSSVTLTGGYGFVHFLANEPGTNASFIGNSQVSGEVAYDRLLGPHDQGALMYGYQGFDFSTGVSFHSHVIQLMWGHRISGRMDFLIGAGPQFTQLGDILTFVSSPSAADTIPPCVISSGGLECPMSSLRISAAGRASLRYRFPKTSLEIAYDHYLTSGSGFFEGSESDIAHLDVTRPLGRKWTGFSTIGFSRNSRVLPLTPSQFSTCVAEQQGQGGASAACPGVTANIYDFGFARIGLRRSFSREFKAYVSYEFNDLAFDSSYCVPGSPCNRISQRHVGTIGVDWTPRPIRID